MGRVAARRAAVRGIFRGGTNYRENRSLNAPCGRLSDTFMRSPNPIMIVMTLDPPNENKGNVTPTTGSNPVTIPTLKIACQKIMAPTPMEMTACLLYTSPSPRD